MKKYRSIADAKDMDEYQVAMGEFEEVCHEHHCTNLFDYFNTTWVPLKQNWVRVWTKDAFTRGCSATSRVEGAHASIKNIITRCNQNLDRVCRDLTLVSKGQIESCKIMRIKQKTTKVTAWLTTSGDLRIELSLLFGRVSHEAMKRIVAQLEHREKAERRYRTVLFPCPDSCSFTTEFGLPCWHHLRLGEPIDPNEIVQDWFLEDEEDEVDREMARTEGTDEPREIFTAELDNRYAEVREILQQRPPHQHRSTLVAIDDLATIAPILPPAPFQTRGRPSTTTTRRRRRDDNSSSRDPSYFEHIEQTVRAEERAQEGSTISNVETARGGNRRGVEFFADLGEADFARLTAQFGSHASFLNDEVFNFHHALFHINPFLSFPLFLFFCFLFAIS